jgi:hypothetical protein
MDAAAFDRLSLAVGRSGTRRLVLGALLAASGTALGLAGGQRASAQGCLANGTQCSDGAECCSGRCHRNRNKGRNTCRQADNQGTCTIEQDRCINNADTCNGNSDCGCGITTRGQSFCHAVVPCIACKRNAECEKVTGRGSKCVGCTACGGDGTTCAAPCPSPG